MEKVDIDLGQEMPKLGGEVPLMVSKAEKESDEAVETCYPHFHYEGEEELEIPDEGTMTVKYKVVFKSNTETEDEEHYTCKVEVQKIIAVEGEKDEAPAHGMKGAEEALDELMEAARKAVEAEDDEEDEGEEDDSEDEGEEDDGEGEEE